MTPAIAAPILPTTSRSIALNLETRDLVPMYRI
jgi:hypothetical protein